MSGGGGGGQSILETPILFLALVFLFFLIVTLGFEFFIHHARHFLLARKKAGLVAALDTMTTEIMLLGVATLFLSVIERSVGGVCVPAKDLGLAVWADFVRGCACCLAKTAGMTECFMRDRGCASVGAVADCCAALAAPGAAPRRVRGLTCPAASLAGVAGVHAVDGADAAAAAAAEEAAAAHDAAANHAHRRALLAAGKAGAGGHGDEIHYCEGAIESGIGGCPPGRRPAISIDAMHQVHIFIFYLAVIHIAASCAVAILASLRIRAWRRWDRAAERIERGLFREAAAAAAVAAADAAKAAAGGGGGGDGKGGGGKAPPSPPPVPAAAGSDVEAGPPAQAQPQPQPQQPQQLQRQPQAAAARPPGLTRSAFAAPPAAATPSGSVRGGGAGGRALVRSGGPPTADASTHGGGSRHGGGGGGGGGHPALAPPPLAELPDAFIPATYLGPGAGTRPWRGRAADYGGPGTTLRARVWEALVCAAVQAAPNVVTRREWHLMRASFLDTHRVGAHRGRAFDFSAYTSASVDDDFAHITGLGLPTWLLLVGFVTLSAAIGWAVWVLVAVAGGLLFAVNFKLVSVVRHVTRGGVPQPLDPSAFWLGRPWLLLPAIKAAVFLIALLWTNTLFFATQFGRHSCFFSPTGMTRSPVPWWAVSLISLALFLVLALNTMPMFSLTVQMGADVKADAIPEGLKAHFAAVGAHLASARAARKLGQSRFSRALSARLPRRADALTASRGGGHGGGKEGGEEGH